MGGRGGGEVGVEGGTGVLREKGPTLESGKYISSLPGLSKKLVGIIQKGSNMA